MRLEASRRSDVALRALQHLRSTDGPVPGKVLAAAVGTSTTFLAQVMAPLLERGWAVSRPGPGGGYAAAPSLDRVSVLDVVEAIEGTIDASTCVLVGGPCGERPCALHEAWLDARDALRAALAARPAVTDLGPGPSPLSRWR